MVDDAVPGSRRGSSEPRKDLRPWVVRHAWLIVTLGGLGAAAALVISVVHPAWFADPGGLAGTDRAEALSRGRDFGLKLAAGAGALAGALLAWGRFEMAKEQADLEREKAELDRARSLAERFGRAVDQLGGEQSDIVLGGLYAMEALGEAAPHMRPQITEVLCAFVRERVKSRGDFDDDNPEEDDVRPLAQVEQSALTILGRRAGWGGHIDLAGANLYRANLVGANFAGANLRGAFICQADLSDSNLEGANLTGANLFGATITGAMLRGAIAPAADLRCRGVVPGQLAAVSGNASTHWPKPDDFP